jgi:hypothetical protein
MVRGGAVTPREEVRAVAARLRFEGERVLWDGKEVRGEPADTPFARLPPVLARATGRLYAVACARQDEGRGAYQHVPDVHLRAAFVDALSRIVPEGVALRRDASRGWTYLLAGPAPVAGSIRVYWSLCAAGAAPFAHHVPRALRAAGVPFQAKLMDDPQAFRRADSAVCYLPADAWDAARPALERAHADLLPWLRPTTPLFASRLAPGLAVAEDPGGEDSFGTHRAALLAAGLWDARDGGDPVLAVEARFRAAGLDLDAPHRGPGSRAAYPFHAAALEVPT